MFERQHLKFPLTSLSNNTNKPPPLIRSLSHNHQSSSSSNTIRLGTPTITLPTNSASFPSSSSSLNLRISKPSPSNSSTSSTTSSFNVSPLNSNPTMGGVGPQQQQQLRACSSLSVQSTSGTTGIPIVNNAHLDVPPTTTIVGSTSSPQSFGLLSTSPNFSPTTIITSSTTTHNNNQMMMINMNSNDPSNNNNTNNTDDIDIINSTTSFNQRTVEERVIVDFEEFEAAKENIIPLKGGRKATDLRRIFGSTKQPLQEIKPTTILSGGGGSSSTSPPTSILGTSTNNTSLLLSNASSFNPLLNSSNNVNACSTPMSPTTTTIPSMLFSTGCTAASGLNSSFNGFNTLVPPPNCFAEDDGTNNNMMIDDVGPMMPPQQQQPGCTRPIFNFSNLISKSKVCFDNHNMKPKLSVERKQFEKRIASLSNHLDPITVWLEYIEWIEKSYPTLSKASQYVPTLQACTKFILSNQQLLERYRNDERYLGVWLKYADQCLDPIDVFTFLETKKICLSHSELYIRWATLLEDRKDLKAADAVLEQGINRGAQPAKSLQTFHTGVKARFMKSILNRTNSSTSGNSSASTATTTNNNGSTMNNGTQQIPGGHVDQRLPFNSLSKKPGSIRPTIGNSGGFRPGPPLPSTMAKPTKMKSNNASLSQKNSPINNFVIYDESNGSAEKIAHAATTRTLPFQIPKELTSIGPRFLTGEQEQEKENNEKPDKWTNYSVPQHGGGDDMMLGMLPLTPTIAKPTCHFSIFVDEEFK